MIEGTGVDRYEDGEEGEGEGRKRQEFHGWRRGVVVEEQETDRREDLIDVIFKDKG